MLTVFPHDERGVLNVWYRAEQMPMIREMNIKCFMSGFRSWAGRFSVSHVSACLPLSVVIDDRLAMAPSLYGEPSDVPCHVILQLLVSQTYEDLRCEVSSCANSRKIRVFCQRVHTVQRTKW